jgi:iron(III) transport system permease protein
MGNEAPVDGGQRRWTQKYLPAAAVSIGLVLIAVPLLAIVVRGLLVWSGDYPHPSFGNFTSLFADPRFGAAVANTVIAGLCTTILSLTLGFTLAFLICRTDMTGRRFLGAMNAVPFFLSPYAGAMAWICLLAQHDGLLPVWARESYGVALEWLNIYSLTGVIFVLTLFTTPYVYLFLLRPLREMDAAFEDTARIHGATFWYTMRHITLPLLLPAFTSSGLVVFVTSAGLFDVPAALGAPRGISFIPTEIFAMARSSSGTGRAAAFAVVVLLATALVTLWQRRFLAGQRVIAVSGKGYRPVLIRLRWPARIAAWSLEAAYIGAAVLLPMLMLLMVSVTKLWTGRPAWRAATAVNFDAILTRNELTRTAIFNSLVLAIVGATICAVLAALQGAWLNRGDPRHRGLVGGVLSLPLGIPGIVLGLGFAILASRTPLGGTLAIILIAYVGCFLPFATRNVIATFLTIDPGLEQMARTSGASWNQTMRHIVMPLLRPSLVASWLLLFIIFIRELGVTILLYAQGTETISVAMLTLSDRNASQVAALALVQMVMALLAFAIFRLGRAPPSRGPARGTT